MKPIGIRGRIFLSLIAVAVAACGALTFAMTTWAASRFEAQLEQDARQLAQLNGRTLQIAVEAQPEVRSTQGLDDSLVSDLSDNSAGVSAEVIVAPVAPPSPTVPLDQAHEYVFGTGAPEQIIDRAPECLTPSAGALRDAYPQPGKFTSWTERCGDYQMGFALTGPSKDNAWLVINALYRGDYTNPVPALLQALLSYSALIVAAAALVAVGLAAAVSRPLARTRQMAEDVAAGDLGVRIPTSGRDEVARLGGAVNQMADRLIEQITELERSNQQQRQFVSDVAHELRTPTATLLAAAESLQNPTTRDQAAEMVAPQLRRLATLTEELLEISRMDAGRAEVVPSQIDLVDLIAEVVGDSGAPEGVSVVAPQALPITVDAARLRVIVRNLLTNALRHGAPPVTITLGQDKDSLELTVHDEGPGVPASIASRAFDRFVRGDESRHEASSGLGLAIAQENAHLLGGTLELGPDLRTFVLRLPTLNGEGARHS